MKIGLYTIHSSHNVGAMLQSYGLVKKLQDMGAEVELVNLYPIEEEDQNHHRRKSSFVHDLFRNIYILFHSKIRVMEQNFDQFHKNLPLSKRFYSVDEYVNTPSQYDVHLVGSDQVWNLQHGYDFGKFYFLNYLPFNSVKIAYGSSFGTTKDIKDIELAGQALSSFRSISVREDTATELVSKLTGKGCTQVLDPTLLLANNEWNKLIPKEPIIKGKYIFFYGVNTDQTTWEILLEAKKRLGAKIVGYPGPLRPQYKFDEFILDGGPLQFINLIKHSIAVVTSSFHGLAFSINFNKKVFLIKYGTRMERMESLIKLLGAEKCITSNVDDVQRILNTDISNITNNLLRERESSLKWIMDNIIKPQK